MSAVAADIAADSVLIGGASAQASANGRDDADVSGWTPGDTKTASEIAAALGLASLLTPGSGGGEGGELPDIAGDMSDGYLGVVSRVLAGWDPDVAADELGSMLADAVADGAYAEGLTITQIMIVVGQAALQWYLSSGTAMLYWVTEDGAACPVCRANEDNSPVRAGTPFDSGATSTPQHPRCRCAILPDWLYSPPGTPDAGEAEDGEEAEESEEGAEDDSDEEPGDEAEGDGEDGAGGAELEEAGTGGGAAEPGPVADAEALADAYSAGHDEGERLLGGQGGAPVRRVTLSDGTEAVVKSGQEPEEALNGYLAGLVARALGIDGTEAALIGDDTLVARLLPGETGAALRAAAGESEYAGSASAELERIMRLQNGQEIGVLDFLTANADRNDGNYLVDGGTVRPIDHALANFQELMSVDGEAEILSPFARYYIAPGADVAGRDGIAVGDLVNPLGADGTAALRSSLESLEGEFSAKGASGQYEFMMSRLALLESA